MTYHPTPEQAQTVIDNLKKIEDQANKRGAFDIGEPEVSAPDHACGTVHCVAGWYAVANQTIPKIKQLIHIKRCDYNDGANLMASHLGFDHSYSLQLYMANNPGLWGNDCGGLMFDEIGAYRGLKFSAKPMTTIIEHWQQVKKNLEELHANRLATSAIDSR